MTRDEILAPLLAELEVERRRPVRADVSPSQPPPWSPSERLEWTAEEWATVIEPDPANVAAFREMLHTVASRSEPDEVVDIGRRRRGAA